MIREQFASRLPFPALPILLWGVFFFLLALRPIEDYDTFWQLQSGKHIWQTKSFIYTDTFSLAADAFRLEHCWLSDLIFYSLYSMGGFVLLNLLKPLAILLCGWLLWRWSVQRDVPMAVALPVLTLCLLASEPSWLVRPQLWSFILSILYLQLLYLGREHGLRAWLWLAPLMLLWANLHAACVFGFVLIGLFGCGELIRALRRQTSWHRIGELVAAGLLTLAASFVNPYGYRIPAVLFGHVNLHDVELSILTGNMEWLPPIFAQVPLFYVVMTLWGVLLIARLRRNDPAELLFFAAFLYMGLSMIRHTTLVSLLAGMFLPAALHEVLGSWRDRVVTRGLAPLLVWGAVGVLAVLLVLQGGRGQLELGLKEGQYPAGAADFIRQQNLPANLYNNYDWGGYLMWRLYPDYLVFLDGRSGSVELFDASIEIDEARDGWARLLDRYGVNTIVTRTCYFDTGGPLKLISALAGNPDWALVYRDDVALVYVRRGAAGPKLPGGELPPREAFRTMLAEASRLYTDDPVRSRALLSMGRAAARLGETAEARRHYGRYLEAVPEDREARAALQLLGSGGG